jgi:hypothetical protein
MCACVCVAVRCLVVWPHVRTSQDFSPRSSNQTAHIAAGDPKAFRLVAEHELVFPGVENAVKFDAIVSPPTRHPVFLTALVPFQLLRFCGVSIIYCSLGSAGARAPSVSQWRSPAKPAHDQVQLCLHSRVHPGRDHLTPDPFPLLKFSL